MRQFSIDPDKYQERDGHIAFEYEGRAYIVPNHYIQKAYPLGNKIVVEISKAYFTEPTNAGYRMKPSLQSR